MINEKQFLNSKPDAPKPTKEDLQIKKLQLQIEQLEEKKKAQQQKEAQLQKVSKLQATSDILKGLIAIGMIILAPFFILGGFLLACAKASGGTHRGKRY